MARVYYQMPIGVKVWMPHKDEFNYPMEGVTVHLITGAYVVREVKEEGDKILICLDHA